jgi:hypothetical protein
MLMNTLGSLAFYGGIVSMPPGSKPAFVFLVVPLGSWLLLTIAVPIAAFVSRRLSRQGAGASPRCTRQRGAITGAAAEG